MRFRSAPAAVERLCAAVTVMLMAPPMRETGTAGRRRNRPGSDRGDVPGWVMITVMTAVVVLALIGVFRTAVLHAVTNAFKQIGGMFG